MTMCTFPSAIKSYPVHCLAQNKEDLHVQCIYVQWYVATHLGGESQRTESLLEGCRLWRDINKHQTVWAEQTKFLMYHHYGNKCSTGHF